MQILDRIEKRRFVGREFLLWLWFESEVFEATLTTQKHGPFGLWVENQLVLSAGKESTRIKGSYPAGGREAKEALLGGKLPETATFRLTFRDRDIAFTLKAERLAISGLKLPTVLDAEPQEMAVPAPPRGKPKKRRTSAAEDEEREADERNESFYERMALTQEVEGLLEGLYAEFLELRLGEAWQRHVLPAQRAWAASASKAAVESYSSFRKGAGKKAPARRKSA
jgi:hypothetical protein